MSSLDNLSQELQGNNYVRMVIQVLEQQEQLKMNTKIAQLEEAVQSYQKQLPVIQNDSSVIDSLKDQLKRFCFISSKKNDVNCSNNSTYQDIRSAFLDSTKKQPDFKQSFAPLETAFDVQVKNHFQVQDPVLLRLEEDTKKMTIFNLSE